MNEYAFIPRNEHRLHMDWFTSLSVGLTPKTLKKFPERLQYIVKDYGEKYLRLRLFYFIYNEGLVRIIYNNVTEEYTWRRLFINTTLHLQ